MVEALQLCRAQPALLRLRVPPPIILSCVVIFRRLILHIVIAYLLTLDAYIHAALSSLSLLSLIVSHAFRNLKLVPLLVHVHM
ncbi:hypothetical protein ZOSMA_251G00320 [Zostera marina]|uniref:Uncharacterized protein n=1 Tax=Zostera marina TaxID=29655 RepID=A0A0K9PG55_ZOSMR|nr:hypothetical protein ZOSMA_251G00320 [Zostera marina]